MKIMWPPGYHHNGFVVTRALRSWITVCRGSLMTTYYRFTLALTHRFTFTFYHFIVLP